MGFAGCVWGDGNRVGLPWEGGADSHHLRFSSRPLNSWSWIWAGSPTSLLSCGSCLFTPGSSTLGLCYGLHWWWLKFSAVE